MMAVSAAAPLCVLAFVLSLGARVWVRKACAEFFPLEARFDLVAPVGCALSSAALLWRGGVSLDTAALTLLLVLTWTLAAIDTESGYFPNVLTFPGILLGIFITPWLDGRRWYDGLVGALLGLLILWFVSSRVGAESMGLGNAKFMAMIGAFVGPGIKSVLLATLCLALLSAPVLWLAWRERAAATLPQIPTGPYFAAATLVHVLARHELTALLGWWPADSAFLG